MKKEKIVLKNETKKWKKDGQFNFFDARRTKK